ncbi:MAG: hypothetical protein K9M98_10315 [Cephaloticoccus sp.]|nr:hypothetical protein [Cephaloticoccus sp.]MCF7760885.1 hypothetical protein [Cephaloticoccus sp.]
MTGIILFGLITTVLGLWMILKPQLWLELAVRYCRLPYMHPLEILIRLGFGYLFITYAADTRFPTIISYAGYLLVAVGVGLAFLRPSYHRHIGITMIQRIGPWFRFTGLVVLPVGIFLIYATC